MMGRISNEIFDLEFDPARGLAVMPGASRCNDLTHPPPLLVLVGTPVLQFLIFAAYGTE
jgi:hypothetical protein